MEIDKYLNKNTVEKNINDFFKIFKRENINQLKFQNIDIVRGEKLLNHLQFQGLTVEQSFAVLEIARIRLSVESQYVK